MLLSQGGQFLIDRLHVSRHSDGQYEPEALQPESSRPVQRLQLNSIDQHTASILMIVNL